MGGGRGDGGGMDEGYFRGSTTLLVDFCFFEESL